MARRNRAGLAAAGGDGVDVDMAPALPAGDAARAHTTGGINEVARFLQQIIPDYQSYLERTLRIQDVCLTAALDAESVRDNASLRNLDEQMRTIILQGYIAQIQLKNIEALRTSGQLPEPDAFQKQLAEIECTTFTDGDYMRNAQYKNFRQSIWNVHHAGEIMPWDTSGLGMDDEDVVVSTQVESFVCPLTQKPFERPMNNKNCSHSYSEDAIKAYIRQSNRRPVLCPQTGCNATVELTSLVFNKVLDRQMKSRQTTSQLPSTDVDDISEY